MRRRRFALQCRLVLAALACAGGQTSSLIHRALVQHAICAEHGEAIHVSDADLSGHTVARGRRADADGNAAISSGHAEEADEHEHCVAAEPSDAGLRSHTRRAVALAPAQKLNPTRALAILVAPISSYLVAPKTSPPRAA